MNSGERVERFARQLLTRWGVLLRDLLVRETLAPPWRELLPLLRRMEARGEIRGGRFVSGFTGEQFARPEALELLREIRRKPKHIRPPPSPMPIRSISAASFCPVRASVVWPPWA